MYITKLTERGLPPRRLLVQKYASQIAQKPVSESWVTRFLHRHPDQLVSKWTSSIDRNRHQADSGVKYTRYFNLLHTKLTKYDVEPQHTYNMDEKGFLIGITGRSKRVFSKQLWEQKQVREAIQDSSRK